MAIRIGELEDFDACRGAGEGYDRKLCETTKRMIASPPLYTRKTAGPRKIDDLNEHSPALLEPSPRATLWKITAFRGEKRQVRNRRLADGERRPWLLKRRQFAGSDRVPAELSLRDTIGAAGLFRGHSGSRGEEGGKGGGGCRAKPRASTPFTSRPVHASRRFGVHRLPGPFFATRDRQLWTAVRVCRSERFSLSMLPPQAPSGALFFAGVTAPGSGVRVRGRCHYNKRGRRSLAGRAVSRTPCQPRGTSSESSALPATRGGVAPIAGVR